MKKVSTCLFVFILGATFVFGQSISAPTPSPNPIPYAISTQITATGSITSTSSKQQSIIDIKPLLPPGNTTVDRTTWRESTTGALISVPFVIYKAGTTTVVLSMGESGITNRNVWENAGTAPITSSYDVKITANANIFQSGTYQKTLAVRMYETNFSSWKSNTAIAATANILLTLTVSGASGISLTVSGSPVSTLDFGPVITSASLSFTATVNSNQAYSLYITSTRGYKLDYWNSSTSQYAPITGENVLYSLSLYNPSIGTKNFNSGTNSQLVDSKSTVVSPFSYAYDGTITLGTITAATAGDYKDVLTFTFAAIQ